MQNLYDFLRAIKAKADKAIPGVAPIGNADKLYIMISQDDADWLEQFLKAPDHELHFKAKRVGTSEDGQPIYAQDYAIAGDTVDVFSLLTEAMMQNVSFAHLVKAAATFFDVHIPNCEDCIKGLAENDILKPNWEFSPHKPI